MNIICPNCKEVIPIGYRCLACGNILPITAANPFILLDIEPKFDLSKEEIQVALINKLTFYHPDRFVNATRISKEIATQNAALLNQAAKILKDEVKRAEILISMQDSHIMQTRGRVVDQEILAASLELQEEIDAAKEQERGILLRNVKKQLENNYQQLVVAFNKNNLQIAHQLCAERNFLIRAKINIENKLPQLI